MFTDTQTFAEGKGVTYSMPGQPYCDQSLRIRDGAGGAAAVGAVAVVVTVALLAPDRFWP